MADKMTITGAYGEGKIDGLREGGVNMLDHLIAMMPTRVRRSKEATDWLKSIRTRIDMEAQLDSRK